MSYTSPKIIKRGAAGKGKQVEKSESPKNSKTKRKRDSYKLTTTTGPVRLRTRSPTRTTVSVTIENNRDSDVDGFAITAYLPQSGWKKLKVHHYAKFIICCPITLISWYYINHCKHLPLCTIRCGLFNPPKVFFTSGTDG